MVALVAETEVGIPGRSVWRVGAEGIASAAAQRWSLGRFGQKVIVMAVDIFDYWRDVAHDARMHPKDAAVLARTDHGFDLRCLPGQLAGLLPTAPVVLLFLSGGLSNEYDISMAASPSKVREHHQRRMGLLPLWAPDEHRDAWAWWTKLTNCIDPNWQSLRYVVALLNIGAYKSKVVTGSGRSALEQMPSSLVVREWARDVLFPQATRGERVVLALRAQRLWGLTPGTQVGKGLFAPEVNRAGHMLHGPLREEALSAARDILRRSRPTPAPKLVRPSTD